MGELPDSALILANDVTEAGMGVTVSEQVAPYVDGIKIGWPLILREGLDVFGKIRRVADVPLIADMKVADIGFWNNKIQSWEGTNSKIVSQAIEAGADYIICHGIVGTSSIQECVDTARERGGRVLTLPYMTHRGARAYFDQPIDVDDTIDWLEELGYVHTADWVQDLKERKRIEEGDWRLGHVSISDLILLMGREVEVDGYIGPANIPEVLRDYRKLTERKICTPGIGRQKRAEDLTPEMQIGNVYEICGGNSGFIVGSSIYKAENPAEAAKEFASYRDTAVKAREVGGGLTVEG